jgi:hypothetical protein
VRAQQAAGPGAATGGPVRQHGELRAASSPDATPKSTSAAPAATPPSDSPFAPFWLGVLLIAAIAIVARAATRSVSPR